MYSNRRFMPFFLQKFLTNLEKFIFAAYIYFFIAIYTFFLVVSSEQNLQSVNIDQTLPIFLLMIMLITQLVKKIRVFSPHSLPVVKKIDDLPLAFLLILSIYTLLIFTGNLFHHTLYPVVFCLVAFMASFTRHLENILIVFFAHFCKVMLLFSLFYDSYVGFLFDLL